MVALCMIIWTQFIEWKFQSLIIGYDACDVCEAEGNTCNMNLERETSLDFSKPVNKTNVTFEVTLLGQS